MRQLYLHFAVLALFLCIGCGKRKASDCTHQYTAAEIKAISGPDSMRVNQQQELTLEVTTPGLCVSDIVITVTPGFDSIYYMEANAKYVPEPFGGCDCEVIDAHFVRVYFSSPITGNIVLTTPPGIGSSVSRTIRVY